MSDIGIFNNDQEKYLSKLIVDALKKKIVIKNKLLAWLFRLFDAPVAKIILSLIDDKLIDRINPKIKTQLIWIVNAGMRKDIKMVESLSEKLINNLVDFPKLTEESEALIIKGIIELIVGLISNKLKK